MDADDLKESSGEDQEDQNSLNEPDDMDDEFFDCSYTKKKKKNDDMDEDEEDDVESPQKTGNQANSGEETRATTTNTNQRENQEEDKHNVKSKSKKPQNRNSSKAESLPRENSVPKQLPQNQNWKSANAFINFVQNFKKDNPETLMGRNIFQICGARWKSMTDEQKQPYIDAANTVKRMKQRNIGESTEHQHKKSVTRVSKRKAEIKSKETGQKIAKVIKLDAKSSSDTDTAVTTILSSMSESDSF